MLSRYEEADKVFSPVRCQRSRQDLHLVPSYRNELDPQLSPAEQLAHTAQHKTVTPNRKSPVGGGGGGSQHRQSDTGTPDAPTLQTGGCRVTHSPTEQLVIGHRPGLWKSAKRERETRADAKSERLDRVMCGIAHCAMARKDKGSEVKTCCHNKKIGWRRYRYGLRIYFARRRFPSDRRKSLFRQLDNVICMKSRVVCQGDLLSTVLYD